MHASLANVELDKPEALHQQVRKHIRDLIVSGKLATGDRLPSDQQLARTWRIHSRTVHDALTALAREGLVARVPRVGTFVRQREEKLTRVGICTTKLSPYIVQLRGEVEQLLTREGVDTRFFIDDHAEVPGGMPLVPLVEAARHRELQGIIFLTTSWERLKWQTKLPIPTAFQGSADLPNKVFPNLSQLAEESLRTLHRQGCRSVGLISAVSPLTPDAEQKHRSGDDLFVRLVSMAGELGMELRNEWMRTPPDQLTGSQEQFGYEQFRQMWNPTQRPDGLLTFPESVSRGVVTALMECQVQVPQELRLVLTRNPQQEFYVPVPVTFADVSTHAVAEALVTQLHRQLRGEPCEPISISYDFVSNEGTKQT